jgi:diguanylate cyclase (GGDEF)-like protein
VPADQLGFSETGDLSNSAALTAICQVEPRRAASTFPSRWLESPEAFLPALDALAVACQRKGSALSIIKIDLDRFRECNSVWSPAVGDAVLRWLGESIRACVRSGDLVGRFRCDRFAIALPDTAACDAGAIAENIRLRLDRSTPHIGSRPYYYGVSIGIAQSSARFTEGVLELLRRARTALDQAKRHGGNRVLFWHELHSSVPRKGVLCPTAPAKVAAWVDRLKRSLRDARLESIWALVAAVDAKDRHTHTHSINVAQYAVGIGRKLQLPRKLLRTIRAAALLHDVGKIGVSDSILTKAGPLTDAEFAEIRKHPQIAVDILGHMSHLADERPMILHHHERFDGTGYPAGLYGKAIPVGARVIAVADAIETMLSARTYKAPYSLAHTRTELSVQSGRQFDPEVVSAALA